MPDTPALPDLVEAWRQQVVNAGGRFTVGAKGTPYEDKLVAAYPNPNGGPAIITPAPDYVEYAYEQWIAGTDLNWNPSHIVSLGTLWEQSSLLDPGASIATAFQGGEAAATYLSNATGNAVSSAAGAVASKLGDAAKKVVATATESLGPWGPLLLIGGVLLLVAHYHQPENRT